MKTAKLTQKEMDLIYLFNINPEVIYENVHPSLIEYGYSLSNIYSYFYNPETKTLYAYYNSYLKNFGII